MADGTAYGSRLPDLSSISQVSSSYTSEKSSDGPLTYSSDQQRALSLWVVMHRALAALSKVSDADIRARGFSPTEWGVLEYLYHKGPQPLAKVGEKILVTSGSVTYVIDKLSDKGFLRRVPCDTDRRIIFAALTDAGEAVMRREFPPHVETICRLLSPLTPEEQDQVKYLLKKAGTSSPITIDYGGFDMSDANTQKWTVDASHSNVEFSVRHMMISTVRGRFSHVEGTIHGDPTDFAQVSIEAKIDATSIDTREDQRDEHLRSADFFDVENHPEIIFKSTRIEPKGNDFVVHGDLTMRGVTRPVSLDTTMEGIIDDPFGLRRMGLTAVGKINRKDFGLNWNQVIEAGGVVVSDEVRLELHAEATLEQ